MSTLPHPVRPFVEFPTVLRANGFAVPPDQTVGFIEAVGLLGPRGMEDIRQAAIAMLAIPKEREDEFDEIFHAFFWGSARQGVIEEDEEAVQAHEPTGESQEEVAEPDEDSPGEDASALERLSRRELTPQGDEAALAMFSRLAPARLPRRRSYRFGPDKRGAGLDMRRILRDAARRDGEVFDLHRRARKTRQRRVLLLIDISGSMADRTEAYLRFAHRLAKASDRFEAFTLGTRLTRITSALNQRNEDRALARVSALVADIDGGTRIGDALQSFLSVPRYAGFARGSAVIVLSDGLERGGPEAMEDAVRRLSRIAWQIHWLNPLATADYTPDTAGINAILPYIDALADGSTLSAITGHILDLGR